VLIIYSEHLCAVEPSNEAVLIESCMLD